MRIIFSMLFFQLISRDIRPKTAVKEPTTSATSSGSNENIISVKHD